MCGENPNSNSCGLRLTGSPPRVRGKLLCTRLHKMHVRLTPACAGKTARSILLVRPTRAHPRVCGENRGRGSLLGTRRGSPPRVRGKRHVREAIGEHVGLTPACAGKTRPACRPGSCRTAHPRVCGENPSVSATALNMFGSPPRVRGKRHLVPDLDADPGLTPACAGKTSSPPTTSPPRAAHPRVCGENQDENVVNLSKSGSPPRVRGKHEPRDVPRACRGLTPACAGKTYPATSQRPLYVAHPRVCGENALLRTPTPVALGSPPRVRGKLLILTRS